MRLTTWCVVALLGLVLSACAGAPSPAPTPPESVIGTPAPTNPTVAANADVVALVDYLKQRGITARDPEESRAAYLYPVPGVAYKLDGGWLFVHPFPSPQAAEARARQLPPELTPSVVDWVDKPHFYRCKSTLVLYLGTSTQILQALAEFCGAQFAGSAPPVASIQASATTLKVGESISLTGTFTSGFGNPLYAVALQDPDASQPAVLARITPTNEIRELADAATLFKLVSTSMQAGQITVVLQARRPGSTLVSFSVNGEVGETDGTGRVRLNYVTRYSENVPIRVTGD